MKNTDFKQPKYVLPMILLPFLFLFFYVWKTQFSTSITAAAEKPGLNTAVGDVASSVQRQELEDKLGAYRNAWKETDGQSAVNAIPLELAGDSLVTLTPESPIDRQINVVRGQAAARGQPSDPTWQDRQVNDAIAALNQHRQRRETSLTGSPSASIDKDPMVIFKQQMAYLDSTTRANDPELKEQRRQEEEMVQRARRQAAEIRLPVHKAGPDSKNFNTVYPEKRAEFISAVIDETVTGYAGSRLRLRLLEDIRAGTQLIKKGTAVFATVSGFSEQRVSLAINTILADGKILPVALKIYDLDGLEGLYVPASAFRDLTRELGGSSVQGVNIAANGGNSQFIMSSVDRLFQSTSSAIASLLRKNRAKLKFNSYLYLIDPKALQNDQKHFQDE